jgi:eukaryotic-like serine/threonine-protein kinase
VKAPIPKPRKALYEFGPFRLDPARHLFERDAKPLQLPPKAFDILVFLVGKKGELLTKAELMSAVWPDTFVEENNLTQYVSMLRKVLGEAVDDQKYIETVPKLGYRFVFAVREISEGDGEMLVARHTQTRIVVREEQEEEITEPDLQSLSLLDTVAKTSDSSALPGVVSQSPALPATRVPLRHRWKWLAACSAVLLVAAVTLLYVRYIRPHPRENHPASPPFAAVKPRYSVAVLGFKNLSGREADNWLSAALAEMLTTELAAGGQLRMVSGEDITHMKSDLKLAETESLAKPTLSEIRNHLGADFTVSGSFVEIGSERGKRIRLDLRLQDTVAGETVASIAEAGAVDDLFNLVSRTGAEMRSKLGTSAVSGTEEGEVQAALPSTPEAERLYAEGLLKLRTFDAAAAQKLLTKAVAEDPHYALGHSALATVWSALGYDERAKAEARRALDLSGNLSRQDRLSIAGQYSELTRDWEKAVSSYQMLFNLFPDSLEYGLRLASAQDSAGKGKDALFTIEKLRKLPPLLSQDPRINLAEAAAAESLGDFQKEREAADRAARNGDILGEQLVVARAYGRLSWALLRLGQPKEAADVLEREKVLFSAAGDPQGVAGVLRISAGQLSEHGEYARAVENYQQALALYRRTGNRRGTALTLNGLANVHYEQDDLPAAKSLYQQALEIQREVGSKLNTAGALGNIANIADAQGELAEARKLDEESLQIFTEVGDQRALGTGMGNLAVLLYEQGDLEGAQKKFEEATEIKRKIGYQRGVAYDLSGLSDVFRAKGDLATARRRQEEALAIREQLSEKHNAASSRLYLGLLALEERRPAEAEKIARDSAEEFRKELSPGNEAAAQMVLARALLDEGKLTDAQAAISRAAALSAKTPDIPLHFDIAITSARISNAGNNSSHHLSFATEEKNMESSLAEARKYGYLEYEYKFRLVLGEIELEAGKERTGSARLEALANDAKSKGFGLMARQAALAAKRQPVQKTN